mmetsp:Transcript_20326/g.60312  ORF Transcript_20326/g.60312 Transcript_20326/m.60312 type:complete len:206 (-) Transcript_20326:149-766(-)
MPCVAAHAHAASAVSCSESQFGHTKPLRGGSPMEWSASCARTLWRLMLPLLWSPHFTHGFAQPSKRHLTSFPLRTSRRGSSQGWERSMCSRIPSAVSRNSSQSGLRHTNPRPPGAALVLSPRVLTCFFLRSPPALAMAGVGAFFLAAFALRAGLAGARGAPSVSKSKSEASPSLSLPSEISATLPSSSSSSSTSSPSSPSIAGGR